MSSLRQIEANRRNALLSTGPNTPEGRAAVARNALRHGLCAQDPVINIEDRAAYQSLLQALIDEHRPSTPTQSLLVEQLAIASWRLARIRSIEAGLFEFRLYTLRKSMKKEHPDLDDRGRLAFVFRYDVQTSILLTLSRYESRAERSFFKNLHELQRLKAVSPAPEVSDSGIGFVQSTVPGTAGPGPNDAPDNAPDMDPDDEPSPPSSSANSIEDLQEETPHLENRLLDPAAVRETRALNAHPCSSWVRVCSDLSAAELRGCRRPPESVARLPSRPALKKTSRRYSIPVPPASDHR